MSTNAVVTHNIPALDERLYSLDPDEIAFLLSQTHIETESDLKSHILGIQAKAYKIHSYPCIRHFGFARFRIPLLPAYERVLKLGRERKNAILLDIACGLGNDTRKVVADGFPVKGVIAADVRQDFWDMGHELFKSNPETFPVSFVAGDVFDPSHLKAVPPFDDAPKTLKPALSSLMSLNPLYGHVSVIHASLLFHLFDKGRQLDLARALAGLLSPEPGSVIFGSQMGSALMDVTQTSDGDNLYFHSPESWKQLWDGQVFNKGNVEVEVLLQPVKRVDIFMNTSVSNDTFVLLWSVIRV